MDVGAESVLHPIMCVGILFSDRESEKAMTIVEYKFDIDEKVITPFDTLGIVTMLGYDEGGAKYYVQTETSSGWLKESVLEKVK